MARFDLVVRSGLVIDGTGTQPYEADVGVSGSRIIAIGKNLDSGTSEIDARGKIVTPGFVDIHTHYDGQITWEETLAPSSHHGVTTVVMGNCGVGFAPISRHQHDMAIRLMEGVEDIPEAVMAKGVPWTWETFPQYLDAIDERRADIDFAAQLPHNPLRVFVMDDRGAALEPPTADDLNRMQALTAEAVQAGAIGVSTTRNFAHRYRDGRNVPSIYSEEDEILALARGLRDAGTGVFQMAPNDRLPIAEQMRFLRRVATESQRPVSFALVQLPDKPGAWRQVLGDLEKAHDEGLSIRGQAMPRPVGILLGLELSLNPFTFHASFRAIAELPLKEKLAAMRNPEVRRRILSETPQDPHAFFVSLVEDTEGLFVLGDPPNYHPASKDSIAAQARAKGVPPLELIYDTLLSREGREIIYRPTANREGERFESAGTELVRHPQAILGLGDGGAHYAMICDAAYTTYFLKHWVGHEREDRRIPLSDAIRMLTSVPAQAVGLNDRGRLKVGMKADINVIDLERLSLAAPFVTYDLPASGRRLNQEATGYDATIVSGAITYRMGKGTGARPGRLVRGARDNANL